MAILAFPFNRSLALTTYNRQLTMYKKCKDLLSMQNLKKYTYLCVFWCKENGKIVHMQNERVLCPISVSVSLWMRRTVCVLHKSLMKRTKIVKLEIVQKNLCGMRFQMFSYINKKKNVRPMPTSRIPFKMRKWK